jgi:hypothetical protein
VKVVYAQSELFYIVGAFDTSGRFPRRLDGRKQQRDKNSNNGNNDKQLNERKSAALCGSVVHGSPLHNELDRMGAKDEKGNSAGVSLHFA